MLLSPERVGHIPERRARLAGHIGTPLSIARVALLTTAIAPNVGPDGRSGHRTTSRGNVSAAATTDLVPQDAANERTCNGSRHIGLAALTRDVLALNPATLLRWSHHGVN